MGTVLEGSFILLHRTNYQRKLSVGASGTRTPPNKLLMRTARVRSRLPPPCLCVRNQRSAAGGAPRGLAGRHCRPTGSLAPDRPGSVRPTRKTKAETKDWAQVIWSEVNRGVEPRHHTGAPGKNVVALSSAQEKESDTLLKKITP